MLLLAGILNVLKIIGIVLLVILAVILFLVLLVLFVPIRYRADASSPRMDLDKFDAEKISASVKFSWLLFVIRGGLEFPKNKEFTLRVFGIKILPKKEKKDKEEKPEKEEKPKKEKKKRKKGDEENVETSAAENAGSGASETATTGESTSSGGDDSSFDQDNAETSGGGSGSEEPKTFLDVLWNIFDGIDNFLKTPLNVFEKLQYTISRVCGKISMIKTTLESTIFDRAYTLVKKKLLKIIKMILPDKVKADVNFGTGDPATTAELLGVYGMMYPKLYKKVNFTPEFEEKVLEGEAHIKGHITLFTIVWSAAVCYFNRDVKKVIKRFKKIINS